MSAGYRASSRSRASGLWMLKLGLAFVSVSLVVVFFEIGFRLAGFEAIYEIYSKPSALWRHDPLLGWHHEPNRRDVFVGPRPWPIEFETLVEINSVGLRGPEVPPDKGDEYRILFLGDSMVAAFEVEYEKTFPVLVGRALSERLGHPVRSINAGVRGYGTDQSLLYFRERGRLLEPDIVVLFHSRNDLVNNRTIHRMRREYGKGAFRLDASGRLDLVGVPVPNYPVCSEFSVSTDSKIEREDGIPGRILCNVQMALFDRSALFSFLTLRINWNPALLRSLYYFAMPSAVGSAKGGPDSDHAGRLTVALIRQLKNEVESIGARFVLIGEEAQLAEIGMDRSKEPGLVIQPLAPLATEDRAKLIFARDSHYNEQGHRRVSEQLLPILVEAVRREPRSKSAPTDR